MVAAEDEQHRRHDEQHQDRGAVRAVEDVAIVGRHSVFRYSTSACTSSAVRGVSGITGW